MLHTLRGVRVLDLTRMLAGPFATMILGDLGADILKVERPDGGDDIRRVGPHFLHGESVYFLSVNRNKSSLALDLARNVDVVIENFRLGVAERLGCDHATLARENPRLITCGITAFGRTGPDRELPAFDLTLQARAGVMGLTGHPGDRPVRCGAPIGDLAGGLYAVIAIASALYERTQTGAGRFIDLGLLDCQVSLLTYAFSNYVMAGDPMGPQGSGHADATPYQCLQAADGYLTVAVFTDAFWPGFCRAVEEPDWAHDPLLSGRAYRRARRAELIAHLEARLATKPRAYWLERLYNEGVPAAPVQSLDEVANDPQVIARGMRATVEHPTVGTFTAPGNPLRWMSDEAAPDRPAPRLGEHTGDILQRVAGYSSEQIASLRQSNIIA